MKITRHEVKGNKILFYHKERQFEKGADNLYHYVGEKEVLWFEWLRFNIVDFPTQISLSSNGAVFSGSNKGGTCFDSDVMEYLRNVKGAKLIKSEQKPWYDESPYGRSYVRGTYTYEIWDLSELFR